LYTSYVSSPQNLPCLKRSSHEKSSLTGLNLPLNHVPYAPVQNCSISATDRAASLSISPLSPLSIGRVGPGAPGRKPEGSSVTGLSATCVGLGGGGGGGAGGFCWCFVQLGISSATVLTATGAVRNRFTVASTLLR